MYRAEQMNSYPAFAKLLAETPIPTKGKLRFHLATEITMACQCN